MLSKSNRPSPQVDNEYLYHIVVSTKTIRDLAVSVEEEFEEVPPEFEIHIFSSRKLEPKEAIRYAFGVLDIRPEWKETLHIWDLNYIYYEKIPVPKSLLDIVEKEGPYYTIVKFNFGENILDLDQVIEYFSAVPEELVDEIRRFRRKVLTIQTSRDYISHDANWDRALLIDAIKIFKKGRTFEDSDNYYFIGELDEEIPLDEIIDLRKKFGDNIHRRILDEAYLSKGLDYLANALFTERCEVKPDFFDEKAEKVKVECEESKHIDPREIKVRIEIPADQFLQIKNPPLMTYEEPDKGIVYIKKDYNKVSPEIVFSGHFGLSDISRIARKLKGIIESPKLFEKLKDKLKLKS